MTAIPPGRAAFLAVDLQRQFIDASSPFVVPGGEDLVARVVAFADRARSSGAHIVWIRQEQRAELPSAASARRFAQGEELNRGAMAALHPTIRPAASDTVLVKPRQSAFFATDLDVTLRQLGVTEVLIAGVTTNVCCFATGVDAIARGYSVTMLSDLTEALPFAGNDALPPMSNDAVRVAALSFFAYSVGTVRNSRDVFVDEAEHVQGGTS